ncbi:hypothetical protein [Rhodococcus sp. JS3073]|uniref:hypothetical protein n=1 Tax=Rhodococcus sp. JS3073 TaxID=3002901 RepID=UPI002285A85D|nr:hypothetical protein [Rhodococcus sp. JS3073]WAM19711.1 hypothetical protein OYT95_39330 [Rhodococcus sp. JS3073]
MAARAGGYGTARRWSSPGAVRAPVFVCEHMFDVLVIGGVVEARAAVDPRADRIEQLRRRMDAIPARSAGPPRVGRGDPLPVGERPAAAGIRTLPVAGPLAELLVHRGLVRGTVAQVTGPASLRASLLASVTGSGHWAAVVGELTLGLLAAVEMGADLSRCTFSRIRETTRSRSPRCWSTDSTWSS